MTYSEHIQELRQRLGFCIIALIFSVLGCFLYSKDIIYMFQSNLTAIKFIPYELTSYFYSTLKVAGFFGILVSGLFFLFQLLAYTIPGLTEIEKSIILPISYNSIVLFFTGLAFCNLCLIPGTASFFVGYNGSDFENIWTIEIYLDILLTMLFITGISFQFPIVQILLSTLDILSGRDMKCATKYIIMLSSLIAALLTPSTDPLTQLILSGALTFLYFFGALSSEIFEVITNKFYNNFFTFIG